MFRGRLAVAVAFLGVGACAHQPEAPLPPSIVGYRARIYEPSTPTTRPPIGIIRAYQDDSITLETSPGTLTAFRLSPAAVLEISRGHKKNTGRGAVIGAIIGGAGLAIVGAADCAGDDDGFFEMSAGECAAGGALVGGGAGALIGMLIGSQIESERWEEIPRWSGDEPAPGVPVVRSR